MSEATDDVEEEIIGDETDILKVFTKVSDEGKDKVHFVLFRSISYTVTVIR